MAPGSSEAAHAAACLSCSRGGGGGASELRTPPHACCHLFVLSWFVAASSDLHVACSCSRYIAWMHGGASTARPKQTPASPPSRHARKAHPQPAPCLTFPSPRVTSCAALYALRLYRSLWVLQRAGCGCGARQTRLTPGRIMIELGRWPDSLRLLQ